MFDVYHDIFLAFARHIQYNTRNSKYVHPIYDEACVVICVVLN